MTTPLSSVPDRVLSPTRSAAAEARRARREHLRDFYGLSKTPGTPGTPGSAGTRTPPLGSPELGSPAQFGSLSMPPTPGTPGFGAPGGGALTSSDARDISSAAFVPAAYYEDLIARASLAELLATTSTLAGGKSRIGERS
jgi:hypothetical protein